MELYMNLKTITKIFMLSVVFITSSISSASAETLYFGSQARFSRNVDYKFFENLSTCRPYTTPIHIAAPLGFPTGYYKTQIVGVSNNKCAVRNYSKDRVTEAWKLSEEFQLPINYAKNLGTLVMREIKYPNERLTHLKKYCEVNKRPSDACVNLTNGTDKNNYFFHVDVNWEKYQTYPYTYSQQIPHQNKTFYTNK